MRDLREDQTDAIKSLRDAVGSGHKRICMQAPTGFGKTVLASALVNSAHARGKKVLFMVPMIGLIDQTVEMFASEGIKDVGVIQADHHQTDWNQPIQVASVQTLKKRTVPQADVILIDECHKWFKFYERLMHKDKMPQFAEVPIIGLSATPWTKHLGNWYTHFHRAGTTQEMIDAGHLSPFTVFAPTHVDLSGIREVAGDYDEAELSQKMQDRTLVADIVKTWQRLGEDRPTLCYAVDRAHAMKLKMQFEAAGVSCAYQDGFTKDADKRKNKDEPWTLGRRSIKRGFHDGSIKVVVSVGTLTTGIDWDVRCISMCRPTKSDMLFVQIVGRGLRTAPGKDDCLILDHSDNHTRLGFVTDIDASYTGLHHAKTPQHSNRTEGIRLPKECPQCSYMKAPGTQTCPSCGFVAQVVSKIEPEKGELRELKRPERVKKEPRVYATMQEKAEFFAELKYYGQRQGYQSGWAAHKYKEKFGVWPNPVSHVPPAKMISQDTLDYIKSRQIRYAMRRTDLVDV